LIYAGRLPRIYPARESFSSFETCISGVALKTIRKQVTE
jgi:hypothetical protein